MSRSNTPVKMLTLRCYTSLTTWDDVTALLVFGDSQVLCKYMSEMPLNSFKLGYMSFDAKEKTTDDKLS